MGLLNLSQRVNDVFLFFFFAIQATFHIWNSFFLVHETEMIAVQQELVQEIMHSLEPQTRTHKPGDYIAVRHKGRKKKKV